MDDLKAATVEQLQLRNRWLNQQIALARVGDPEAQVTPTEGYLEKRAIQDELRSRGENVRPETGKSTPESRALGQRVATNLDIFEENRILRDKVNALTAENRKLREGKGDNV